MWGCKDVGVWGDGGCENVEGCGGMWGSVGGWGCWDAGCGGMGMWDVGVWDVGREDVGCGVLGMWGFGAVAQGRALTLLSALHGAEGRWWLLVVSGDRLPVRALHFRSQPPHFRS